MSPAARYSGICGSGRRWGASSSTTAAGACWSPTTSPCSSGEEHTEGLIRLGRYDPETDILILDGIPRNVAQARLMDNYIDVKRLYYLDCADKEKMVLRLKRRALHENRLDDASDSTIQTRLYVYEAETAPVLSHYPPDKVCRIDTGRTPIEVLADILTDARLSCLRGRGKRFRLEA